MYDARQKPASKKANAHACARYRAASAARRERRARRCSAPKAKGRPELSAVGNRTKVSCAPHVARQSEVARGARNFRPEHRRSPPISRVLLRRAMSRAMTVIPLGPPLPTGSSRLPADSASSVVVRLFGVAPDGGCRVSPAPKKEATRLCGPVPRLRVGREASAMCGRALPGIPLCGARTFLSPGTNPGQRRSGRLRSAIITAAVKRLSSAASCLRAAASPSLHRIRATAARWMLRVAM